MYYQKERKIFVLLFFIGGIYMNQKNEEQDLNTNISAYTTFKSKDILYLLEDYIALDEKTDIQDFLTELFAKFDTNSELKAWANAQRLEPKELSFLITESLGQDFAKNFDEYLTNVYDMGEFKESKVKLIPLEEEKNYSEIKDEPKNKNLEEEIYKADIGSIVKIDDKEYFKVEYSEQGLCYKDYDAFENRPDDVCYICESAIDDYQDNLIPKTKEIINKEIEAGGIITKNSLLQDIKKYLSDDYYKKITITDDLIETLASNIFDTVDWQSASSFIDEELENWDLEDMDNYKKHGLSFVKLDIVPKNDSNDVAKDLVENLFVYMAKFYSMN